MAQATSSSDVPSQVRTLGRSGGSIEVADPSVAAILSFYGLDGLALALRERKWTAAEEVRLLLTIAQDPDQEPKDRLKAMKQVREVVREVAATNGVLQTQTMNLRHEGPGGATVSVTSSVSRIATALAQRQQDVEEPATLPFAAVHLKAVDPAAAPPDAGAARAGPPDAGGVRPDGAP